MPSSSSSPSSRPLRNKVKGLNNQYTTTTRTRTPTYEGGFKAKTLNINCKQFSSNIIYYLNSVSNQNPVEKGDAHGWDERSGSR